MADALIAAARAGERAAMEQLVSQHEVSIRLYAARLVPGHAQADDIAQEAFLTAFGNLARFDESRDFGHWLRGIVRNLALREWQRISRDQSKSEDLAAHVERLAAENAQEASGEQMTALTRCLAKLPEKSGQLLQMVYELGIPHSEVARQIGSSLDAVKQAISRLRFKLKECMEKELAGAA